MLEIVLRSVGSQSPFPGVPASDPMSKWQSDTRIPRVLYSALLRVSDSTPQWLWAFCQDVLCWLVLRSHARARVCASCIPLAHLPFVAPLPFRAFDLNVTVE